MGKGIRVKAALTACSDPMLLYRREDVERLKSLMEREDVEVVLGRHLFDSVAEISGKDKADELTGYFRDPDMDFIFDISGGDIANSVLQELDYEAVRGSRALFCGYSDLTTVLNAVYARTGRETLNYQVRNLLYDHGEAQRTYFREHILAGNVTERDLEYRFLRGHSMRGRVLAGNIRCFLKLAGTPFFPDLSGAILLLEAYSGTPMKMTAYLHQLKQLGVFEKINGILLGRFSEMEKKGYTPAMRELIEKIVPSRIPIAATPYVGHETDARAVCIGREYSLKEG